MLEPTSCDLEKKFCERLWAFSGTTLQVFGLLKKTRSWWLFRIFNNRFTADYYNNVVVVSGFLIVAEEPDLNVDVWIRTDLALRPCLEVVPLGQQGLFTESAMADYRIKVEFRNGFLRFALLQIKIIWCTALLGWFFFISSGSHEKRKKNAVGISGGSHEGRTGIGVRRDLWII